MWCTHCVYSLCLNKSATRKITLKSTICRHRTWFTVVLVNKLLVFVGCSFDSKKLTIPVDLSMFFLCGWRPWSNGDVAEIKNNRDSKDTISFIILVNFYMLCCLSFAIENFLTSKFLIKASRSFSHSLKI